MIRGLLDAVFGPRCPFGCGQRLFPNDIDRHNHQYHRGDPRLGSTTTTTTQGETA